MVVLTSYLFFTLSHFSLFELGNVLLGWAVLLPLLRHYRDVFGTLSAGIGESRGGQDDSQSR